MIDVQASLNSGQAFSWQQVGEWNIGVVNGKVVRVKQVGKSFKAEGADASFFKDYFRLNDDFEKIKNDLNRDAMLNNAVQSFPGLRILRQDPWECALSFACTPLNNVKRITLMLNRLRSELGDEKEAFGLIEHLFPSPEVIVDAGEQTLRRMGFGFRARFVIELSKAVHENGLDLNGLRNKTLNDARSELMTVHGIGGKVADCILLFSCDKLESFPVDVWIDRVMRKNYRIRGKGIEKTREFGMKKFGVNAGYAQQFLYHAARNKKI